MNLFTYLLIHHTSVVISGKYCMWQSYKQQHIESI